MAPRPGRGGLGRVVMVVPTYNEALNLAPLVERLRRAQPDVDVLVVDDGSPDGTGALADAIAAADPQVTVLHRAAKEGLGAAYLHGFRVALGARLRRHRRDGRRRLPPARAAAPAARGAARRRPRDRLALGPGRQHRQLAAAPRAALPRRQLLHPHLLGIRVRDATAGYRLFRRTTLERIDLESIESSGYVFQADLAFRTAPGRSARRRGADRVRRARARRLEDEPRRGHRVAQADHPLGARRARAGRSDSARAACRSGTTAEQPPLPRR